MDREIDGQKDGGADREEIAGARAWIERRAAFFDPTQPVILARAPGRLDLMGGIADYSGALVLQLPIAAATWVAVQEIAGEGAGREPELRLETEVVGELGGERQGRLSLRAVVPDVPLEYGAARDLFRGDPARAWMAYVAGALVVLHRERGCALRRGLRVLVRSDVPLGKGVSSSASVEVAALEALAGILGVALDERDLALLAQKVENFVVGAPCGVMDQMTAACGRRDHLLELLCQPAELLGHLPLPPGVEVFGIDSGIRHAVSGADYGTVRAAAFMGYRIVAGQLGLEAREVGPGRVAIADPILGGYLANLSPEDWRARFEAKVPARLTGAEFLERHLGSTDAATSVDRQKVYPVREATAHPIHEHARVKAFRALLAGGAEDEGSRIELGALMFESHASYSRCGLGSEGTDRLVELAREAGPSAGIYGAKITGGGSGGTVAILARRGARDAVETLAAGYRDETGQGGHVFAGSSPGARVFGIRWLGPSSGRAGR